MWKLFGRVINVAFVLALINAVSFAESQVAATQTTLSLNQAIAKTIEHSPELKSFGYQVQVQEGLLVQAGLAANPELRMEFENVLGTGDFNSFDRLETTLSIGWVLEHAVRKQRVNVAQAGVSLWHTEAEIARINAAAETARRFLACLANQERLLNAKEAVELAQETIKAVQKRVAVSKSPRAELARSQADLAIKKLEHDDVQHAVETSYRRLAAQWGDNQVNFTQVSGNLFTLPTTASFDVLKDRIENNTEFTRILSQQRVNEAELRLAKAMSKPQWQISAGVRRFEEQDDQALVLDFTVPLTFKNRNQGKIAATNAKLAKLNADSKVVQVRINAQLFELHQELIHSIHRTTALRDVIIPAVTQAAQDSQQAYERGRYSYLEWQAVQASLLDSKKKLLEAVISAHLHVIEIEQATGVQITQASKFARDIS